jgi:hypothetical protein
VTWSSPPCIGQNQRERLGSPSCAKELHSGVITPETISTANQNRCLAASRLQGNHRPRCGLLLGLIAADISFGVRLSCRTSALGASRVVDVVRELVHLEREEQRLGLEIARLQDEQHPTCQAVVAIGCRTFFRREGEIVDALIVREPRTAYWPSISKN